MSMCISKSALCRALRVRDLTNPDEGPHALQSIVDACIGALAEAWQAEVRLARGEPVVSIADNYDRLRYPPETVTRDARYSRYVCDVALLRTQTSALVPPALRELAKDRVRDTLLACPGVVYRRDCIDRVHSAEPHQLDLWRIRPGSPLGDEDLREMIARVVAAVLPGWEHRVERTEHPYTLHGLQIDVRSDGGWLEVGECGLAHPAVLADAGLDVAQVSGLAMGLGLDRLLMLRKGIDDIRLLRSTDPRVATQMQDLSPYRAVSCMPPIRRDLSLVVAADTTSEDLGDRARRVLGERAAALEAIEVVAETSRDALPAAAVERLGIRDGQKNVLLRLVIRDLEWTLTHAEANVLRDEVYGALHEGSRAEWAGR